jgi:hypothetical protein
MQKFINCFQNLNNDINIGPSLFVLFITTYFFYFIQYILNNYIINSTESFIIFSFGSIGVYILYYVFDFCLTKLSKSYKKIEKQAIKYYVLSNLIKSALLFVYTPNVIFILYDTMYQNEWNNLKIKNMASLYAIPDFVSLFMVQNMHRSTKIHHILVMLFYICSLINDYTKENIFRPLVIYAVFSTLSYPVNFILASRFLELNGLKKKLIPAVFLLYLICCSINWCWNIYYIQKLMYIDNNIYIYIYNLFISFIVWDDIVLMKWLRYKSTKNT